MIINALGQEARTNLKTERAEFSVSANKAKKFLHIAVRNLYSNPVLASIVEVSQNAYDEHVRRKIEKTPFIVTLPTSFYPTFSVRDFGAGISHEFMLNGYTQALESTKDNDSEMSGGWGLGRLALLSLASTYNVTTYIKGVERNYSIFESENGIEILLTLEKPTTEKDGTLVSAPVPPDKINQFPDCAQRAFRYYEVKPTIKGDSYFKLNEPVFALRGDGWAIEGTGNQTSAVCGIYHYQLSARDIPNLTPVHSALLGNVGLVMFFGASDLSPMANRQGLYYNEKTIVAVKKKLDEIEKSVVGEIQKKFDICKSFFEAKKLWGEMFDGQGVTRINQIFRASSKITWNGIAIEHNRIDDVDKIVAGNPNAIDVCYVEMAWRRGGNRPNHNHGYKAFAINSKYTLFINDLPGGRGFLNRAKSYVRENAQNSKSAIVLSFTDDAAKIAFFAKTNLTEDNFTKISTIVAVKTQREAGSLARARSKIFKWNGNSMQNRSHYSQCWEIAEVDFEEDEEGIYVMIDRYIPNSVVANHSMNGIRRAFDMLVDSGQIAKDTPIYGIRETSDEAKKVKNFKDWVDFDTIVSAFVKTYKIPKEELQILADAQEYSGSLYNIPFGSTIAYQNTEEYVKKIENAHLKKYIESIVFLKAQTKLKEKNNFEQKHRNFIRLGGNIQQDIKPTFTLSKSKDELYRNLPIMKFITSIQRVEEFVELDGYLKLIK